MVIALLPGEGHAQTAATASALKAAFLYNFAKFVEWPPEARPGDGQAFVVAVLGNDPFGRALDEAFSGKTLFGHRSVVRRVETLEEARRAQIVFVSSSEDKKLEQVLSVLARPGVLTVGEMEGFARRGGIIGFRMDQRRVRFDINAGRASQARLKLSSELLKLARIVPAEDAR
jgi:hypothetical protein